MARIKIGQYVKTTITFYRDKENQISFDGMPILPAIVVGYNSHKTWAGHRYPYRLKFLGGITPSGETLYKEQVGWYVRAAQITPITKKEALLLLI